MFVKSIKFHPENQMSLTCSTMITLFVVYTWRSKILFKYLLLLFPVFTLLIQANEITIPVMLPLQFNYYTILCRAMVCEVIFGYNC